MLVVLLVHCLLPTMWFTCWWVPPAACKCTPHACMHVHIVPALCAHGLGSLATCTCISQLPTPLCIVSYTYPIIALGFCMQPSNSDCCIAWLGSVANVCMVWLHRLQHDEYGLAHVSPCVMGVLVGSGGWLSSDGLRGGLHSTAKAPNNFSTNNTSVQKKMDWGPG